MSKSKSREDDDTTVTQELVEEDVVKSCTCSKEARVLNCKNHPIEG